MFGFVKPNFMKKNLSTRIFATLVALLFIPILNAHDTIPVNPSGSTPQQNSPSKTIDSTKNRDTGIKNGNKDLILIDKMEIRSGINGKISKTARLGDSLIMRVSNLKSLVDKSSLDNPIVLYINNIPFGTIVGHHNIRKDEEISFVLDRFSGDNSSWNKILRSGLLKKSFDLNVGLLNKSLVSNDVEGITFYLRSYLELIPFLLLIGLIITLTWYLVFKKGLLQVTVGGITSYSVSSIHLFFWTIIVLTSYIIIWWCCDDINSLDSSNLILLGISAATTSAGAVINSTQNAANKTLSVGNIKSGSFIMDLFSQNNVISIDRYQLVMFNLVVGVFFIYRVLAELTMPVLDPTLLTLLGISSLTYASVKAVKNTPTPIPDAGQQAATPPTGTVPPTQ